MLYFKLFEKFGALSIPVHVFCYSPTLSLSQTLRFCPLVGYYSRAVRLNLISFLFLSPIPYHLKQPLKTPIGFCLCITMLLDSGIPKGFTNKIPVDCKLRLWKSSKGLECGSMGFGLTVLIGFSSPLLLTCVGQNAQTFFFIGDGPSCVLIGTWNALLLTPLISGHITEYNFGAPEHLI